MCGVRVVGLLGLAALLLGMINLKLCYLNEFNMRLYLFLDYMLIAFIIGNLFLASWGLHLFYVTLIVAY